MLGVIWGDLVTDHQPLHGHIARHADRFYRLKSAEYPVPDASGNTMVLGRLVKMMVEMMLSQYYERFSDWPFTMEAAMRYLIKSIHANQSENE